MVMHYVTYRRTVVYEAQFDASFVDDGTLTNDALADGEYGDVVSEVYECSCGDRFYKESTVAEHLAKVQE